MLEPPLEGECRVSEAMPSRMMWLPSAITSSGLLLGCLSLASSLDGHFQRAAIFIYLALLCDVLDGLVARLSRTMSAFGKELDSLSDLVAFGVAPAGLAYAWALRPAGLIGALIIGLFALAAALRLARYNLESKGGLVNHHRFVGMPVPGAASVIAGLAYCYQCYPELDAPVLCACVAVVILLLSGLMISRVPYPAFKVANLRSYVWLPITGVVVTVVAFIVPGIAAVVPPLVYLAWGPLLVLRDATHDKGQSENQIAHIPAPSQRNPPSPSAAENWHTTATVPPAR
ncbi:MAG TPA: CDP-diacylglycerol--serine O-phosphatidyltransferase [Candidatus Binataceae bacterium]|nr:CDP-diacylglycerol--serine O-phosphatidyltransferase [Candidatus Binataceae bacterium]